jgi:HEPN domain-containing protein
VPSASFHAQQAAEKALKAYLVWVSEERVPRTHSLPQLGALLVARGGQAPPAELLLILAALAVDLRYPDTPPPSEDVARQALVAAGEVVDFVRARCQPPAQTTSTGPETPCAR